MSTWHTPAEADLSGKPPRTALYRCNSNTEKGWTMKMHVRNLPNNLVAVTLEALVPNFNIFDPETRFLNAGTELRAWIITK